MQKQVSPAVVWSILGLVVVAVLIIGLRMFNPSYKPDRTGSEATMQQYQKTGSFYNPPIPAGVPGAQGDPTHGGAPTSTAPGAPGYNFTPPSH